MVLTLKIDISGAQDRIKKINAGITDLREPFEQSGEEISKFFGEENFAKQGKALGTPWGPLAASTLLARKNRTGHYENTPIRTDKILIWTGALKSGFKKTVKKTTLIVENTVAYFKFNQGSRPMIKATTEVLDIVSKHLMDYIRKISK